MDLITLTTDFGNADGYLGSMKGVILQINPKARVIDISYDIKPQNIVQGAFVLYSAIDFFPDAVHVGVIDPGVGSNRSGLIIECATGFFVGPDNGLLLPAAKKRGIKKVYRITNYDYCLKDISSTFHGRDIFAPIAAHITMGVPCEEMGEEIDKYCNLELFKVKETDKHLIGKVLNIDRFGNIITNISQKLINNSFKPDDDLSIEFEDKDQDGHIIKLKIPHKNTYSDAALGDCICMVSSSGFLEIAANQMKANELLKLELSNNLIIRVKK
jgi:S-adenosylmethionine hydrolase